MNGTDDYLTATSTLRNLVAIEPSDTLVFKILSILSSQVTFSITNITTEHYIAFKVKTTNPQRYLVRPNQGIIGPEGKASITILIQEKDCHELLQLHPMERENINDKFLIQSIIVDTQFCESLSGKAAREVADDLNKLWNTVQKNQLYKKKLKCTFITENETKENQYKTSGGSMETKDSWRGQKEQIELYQTNIGNYPGRRDDEIDNGQTDKQKLEALRAKYDELVTYTVQVTAQRDRLGQDLEKAQKTALDPSSGGLRNRRGGVGNDKNSSNSSRSGGNTRELGRQQGNNNIVVYLIIALIAYVIGRYF